MKYFRCYTSYLEGISELTMEERGRLFTACLEYASGKEPCLPGNERFIWPTIKGDIDRRNGYEEKEKVTQREKEVISNTPVIEETKDIYDLGTKEKEKYKREKKRFVPPTVDMVRDYCLENEIDVDPEAFVAYYDSVGWKVGRKKMVSWKGAVRTWGLNEKRWASGGKKGDWIDNINWSDVTGTMDNSGEDTKVLLPAE